MKICQEETCTPVEHLWWKFSTKVFNGYKPLTVDTKKLHHKSLTGSWIHLWFLLFHYALSKESFKVDLKWNPLRWNWLLLRILSGGQKVLYIKKKKNYLFDLSHGIRKPFSPNRSCYFFFYIRDSKPAAVRYAVL